MFQDHNVLQKVNSSVLFHRGSVWLFLSYTCAFALTSFLCGYLSGVLEESIGQLSSIKAKEIPNACFIQRQPNFLQQSPRLCLFSKLLFDTSWMAWHIFGIKKQSAAKRYSFSFFGVGKKTFLGTFFCQRLTFFRCKILCQVKTRLFQ